MYISYQDQVNIDEKIDGLYVHLHEIRQVTGARCLADGHSAAFLINRLNKEAEMEQELNNNNNPDDSIEDDIARKDSYQKGKVSSKLFIHIHHFVSKILNQRLMIQSSLQM